AGGGELGTVRQDGGVVVVAPPRPPGALDVPPARVRHVLPEPHLVQVAEYPGVRVPLVIEVEYAPGPDRPAGLAEIDGDGRHAEAVAPGRLLPADLDRQLQVARVAGRGLRPGHPGQGDAAGRSQGHPGGTRLAVH